MNRSNLEKVFRLHSPSVLICLSGIIVELAFPTN